VERHWLNGLPFQPTELAHHIVEEMGAWLTPRETIVKDGLERPQFLQEPFDIVGDNVKRGNGKAFAGSPTGW
jgi:hypothetical protein